MAATIVLFPLFASAVFLLRQRDVVAERPPSGVGRCGPGVAGGRPVRLSSRRGRGGRCRPDARSGGLRDVSVSISRGADATVVVVSGEAPGLLPGMSVSVTARSVTPTEEWQTVTSQWWRRIASDRRGNGDVAAMIVVVPLALGLVLLFVCFGRQGVAAEGVTHAAAVAARAASQQRSAGDAAGGGTGCGDVDVGRGRHRLCRRPGGGGVGVGVGAGRCGVGHGDVSDHRDRRHRRGVPLGGIHGLLDDRLSSDVRSMSAVAGLGARVRDDERGAGYLAAFIVLFSTLLLAGVGVLVDSSRLWTAQRQSSSIALEAARAGANAISVPELYEGAGIRRRPRTRRSGVAAAAAGTFVSQAGASLQSVSVDGNRVTVVVSASVDSWFPLMSGRTVTQRASADAVVGLAEPVG